MDKDTIMLVQRRLIRSLEKEEKLYDDRLPAIATVQTERC